MSDQGTPQFDASPLTEPVDPRALVAFTRSANSVDASTPGLGRVGTTIVGIAVSIVLLGVGWVVAMLFGGLGGEAMHPAGTVLLTIVIAAILGAVLVLFVKYSRDRAIERYRLTRFAEANNMVYVDSVFDPPLPGMIFDHGSGRESSEILRGFAPRFVEFANYRYTTKSGDNKTTHRWGYVAVKLDVPLPHIVLDAVVNNGLGSNLPTSISGDQRLSLEGDFDHYFHLYCPSGYETDALYLFTPDIMARFIDHAAVLDVEIIDDWLFLYLEDRLSTTDPATWAWLFGTVGALMTKFEQWARWRDDRLQAAPPQATPPSPAQPPAAQPHAEQQPVPAASIPEGPVPLGPVPIGPGTEAPVPVPAGAVIAPTPRAPGDPVGVAPEGRQLRSNLPWVRYVLPFALFLVIAVPVLVWFSQSVAMP